MSRDEREAAVSEAKRLADAGVVGAGVDELVEELRGATVNVATTATIGTSVGTGAGGS